MEARAYNVFTQSNQDDDLEEVVETNYTNFDVNDLFCFTIINDEEGDPEFIEILSRTNVRCNLLYDQDLVIELVKHFKQRDKYANQRYKTT